MAIDLFCRGVGNAPVVRPVTPRSAVAFGEVGRNRSCRADHLIGNRLQRSWNPHDQLDRQSRCFEGFRMGDEVGFRGGFGLLTSGSFDALPQAGGSFDVKGAAHRLDRLALDLERSTGYSSLSIDPEATMPPSRNLPSALCPLSPAADCWRCFLPLFSGAAH